MKPEKEPLNAGDLVLFWTEKSEKTYWRGPATVIQVDKDGRQLVLEFEGRYLNRSTDAVKILHQDGAVPDELLDAINDDGPAPRALGAYVSPTLELLLQKLTIVELERKNGEGITSKQIDQLERWTGSRILGYRLVHGGGGKYPLYQSIRGTPAHHVIRRLTVLTMEQPSKTEPLRQFRFYTDHGRPFHAPLHLSLIHI